MAKIQLKLKIMEKTKITTSIHMKWFSLRMGLIKELIVPITNVIMMTL